MTRTGLAFLAASFATAALAQTAPNPGTRPAPDYHRNVPTTAPAPATSMAPISKAEADMRYRLAKDGYTDVQGLRQEGESWTGTAMHDGRRHAVRAGPDGRIMRAPQR